VKLCGITPLGLIEFQIQFSDRSECDFFFLQQCFVGCESPEQFPLECNNTNSWRPTVFSNGSTEAKSDHSLNKIMFLTKNKDNYLKWDFRFNKIEFLLSFFDQSCPFERGWKISHFFAQLSHSNEKIQKRLI